MEKKRLLIRPVNPWKYTGFINSYPLALELGYPVTKLAEALQCVCSLTIRIASYEKGVAGAWRHFQPVNQSLGFKPEKLTCQQSVLTAEIGVNVEQCHLQRQQLKQLIHLAKDQPLLTITEAEKSATSPILLDFDSGDLIDLIQHTVSGSYFNTVKPVSESVYLQGELVDSEGLHKPLLVKPNQTVELEWHQQVRAYDIEDIKDYLLGMGKDLSEFEIQLPDGD